MATNSINEPFDHFFFTVTDLYTKNQARQYRGGTTVAFSATWDSCEGGKMRVVPALFLLLVVGCAPSKNSNPSISVQTAGLISSDESIVSQSVNVELGGFDQTNLSDAEEIQLSIDGEATAYKKVDFTVHATTISVWTGVNEESGEESYLIISTDGNDSYIKIRVGSIEKEIYSPNNGSDVVMNIMDSASLPPVGEDSIEIDPKNLEYADLESTGVQKITAGGGTITEYVVNLAYTAKALSSAGSASNIAMNFSTGIAMMNRAFENSEMGVKFIVGDVAPVKYSESNSLSQSVTDMAGGKVIGLPTSGRATVMAVGVWDPNYDGYAQIGGKYSAIEVRYLSTVLLAHELGHVLGGVHKHYHDLKVGSNTIMIAYGYRELIYSNPYVDWNGYPAGDADSFTADVICDRVGTGCHLWEYSTVPTTDPSEIIMDDHQATKSGTWSKSSAPNPYGTQSLYSNSGGTMRWSPNLSATKNYDVYVWFTHHSNRSSSVPYTVRRADGTTASFSLNQKDSSIAGRWHKVGTYSLGSGSYVQVSSSNGQASGDAVRFVASTSTTTSSSVVIMDDHHATKSGTWSTSSAAGYYGTKSLYSNSGGKMRWTPSISSSKSYKVYIWYTYHSNRSTSVPYVLRKADGTLATFTMNHADKSKAGQWTYIGTYTLGSGSYLEVSSSNGQASGDAVKFE